MVLLKCKSGATVKDCADGDAATTIDDLQLQVPLAKTASVTSKPLDSGFPGLRLRSTDGFSAGIGFEMDLAFGVDRTNGFYIPTNAFGSQPELRVQATASLPSAIDAQLAFIPVKLTDKSPGTPDVAATIGVDLAAGGSDNKITLGQLGSATITPTVSACANVKVGLETGASPLVLAAPLTLYLADTGTVLVRRAARAEPLMEAHREHAYQRLTSVRGLPHITVSLLVAGMASVVTAAWALLAWETALVVTAVVCGAFVLSPSVGRGRSAEKTPALRTTR